MANRKRVLIVDDDAVVRERISSILQKHQYGTTRVESGEEALALLESSSFDALFVDIQLPGLSGIELIGRIHESSPDTPVIIITAYGSIETAIEAMRAGAFDYLLKPITPDAMLHGLERAFTIQALEDVIERTLALSDAIDIQPDELVFDEQETPAPDALRELAESAADQGTPLKQLEEFYIDAVLKKTGGNKMKAGRILGVNRTTLYRRSE